MEAVRELQKELEAGRGGDERAWLKEIESELPKRDSLAILKIHLPSYSWNQPEEENERLKNKSK